MISQKRQVIIASFILFPLMVLTYVNFLIYKPKVLRPLTEVKGLKTKGFYNLPLPDGYENLSTNSGSFGKQISARVPKSATAVQTFYKNILLTDGWMVKSEISTDSLYTTKFKNKTKNITVTSAPIDAVSSTVNIDMKIEVN